MKVHFMALARDEFAGRVLDGPCEGDGVQADGPYFEARWQRDPVLSDGYNLETVASVMDNAVYKWLSGYRAWAWVQPVRRRYWFSIAQ